MIITGKIISVGQEQSGTTSNGKSWRKREYVLETEGQYPKKIAFSVMNANIDKLNLQHGQWYGLEVDIESRQYKEQWYTSVTAWKVNM